MSPTSFTIYRTLAAGVELFHALVMIAWGVGLPLLVWHRYKRLSRIYMWYSIVFVTTSALSNLVLGECFLTTLARHLWGAAGGFRERVPFTVLFTNAVAGIRPSTQAAVRAWQRRGFAVVGRLPGAFRHARHGEVDALVMFREL